MAPTRSLLGLAPLLLVAVQVSAQRASTPLPHEYRDSAVASVVFTYDDADTNVWSTETTTAVSYTLHDSWSGAGMTWMLIKETNVQRTTNGSEAEDGDITIEARVSDGGKFNKILWSDTLPASEVIFYNLDYFEAIEYGCCGADDGAILYRYTDGAALMALNFDRSQAEVPHVDMQNLHSKRYIGYLSDRAVLPGGPEDTDSNFLGALTYVDPVSLKKQRVVFLASGGSAGSRPEPIEFDRIRLIPSLDVDRPEHGIGTILDLWSKDKGNDPTDFSDFSIELSDSGGDGSEKIIIPVRRDRLDISHLHSDWFKAVIR